MMYSYPLWRSLQDTRKLAKNHAAGTGHKYRMTELGAFCKGCSWSYIAVRIDDCGSLASGLERDGVSGPSKRSGRSRATDR